MVGWMDKTNRWMVGSKYKNMKKIRCMVGWRDVKKNRWIVGWIEKSRWMIGWIANIDGWMDKIIDEKNRCMSGCMDRKEIDEK